MALAGIERGRGTREKKLQRILSEGKKIDGGFNGVKGIKD